MVNYLCCGCVGLSMCRVSVLWCLNMCSLCCLSWMFFVLCSVIVDFVCLSLLLWMLLLLVRVYSLGMLFIVVVLVMS